MFATCCAGQIDGARAAGWKIADFANVLWPNRYGSLAGSNFRSGRQTLAAEPGFYWLCPYLMPDPLNTRLKHLIVTTLKLEDVTPAELADDEPLIGSGLNLDSIDALELVVTLEKEFGIKIGSSEESRQALASIAHLAEFIRARADPARLPS